MNKEQILEELHRIERCYREDEYNDIDLSYYLSTICNIIEEQVIKSLYEK